MAENFLSGSPADSFWSTEIPTQHSRFLCVGSAPQRPLEDISSLTQDPSAHTYSISPQVPKRSRSSIESSGGKSARTSTPSIQLMDPDERSSPVSFWEPSESKTPRCTPQEAKSIDTISGCLSVLKLSPKTEDRTKKWLEGVKRGMISDDELTSALGSLIKIDNEDSEPKGWFGKYFGGGGKRSRNVGLTHDDLEKLSRYGLAGHVKVIKGYLDRLSSTG